MRCERVVILGGGMTGLAAGVASGGLVLESRSYPGGICASYCLAPGSGKRLHGFRGPDMYRFEIGGGHWIWGAEPLVRRLIGSLSPLKTYERRASVLLADRRLLVPYPIQYHLGHLGLEVAGRCLVEMANRPASEHKSTLREWVYSSFGPTLTSLFFGPFHELYTAGLWNEIAPADAAKSPFEWSRVVRGVLAGGAQVGYNAAFSYPTDGLDVVAAGLAQKCRIEYNATVTKINTSDRQIECQDGSCIQYEILISTLPLSCMAALCQLEIAAEPDPYTSVIVVNLGARKGRRCPDVHWVYVPQSAAGFHRVGFYSNVDVAFLPERVRNRGTHAAIYVEKAQLPQTKENGSDDGTFEAQVVRQLQEWEWIEDVEVIDTTHVEVAYTWTRPRSQWREQALEQLAAQGVYQVGRYARWANGVTDQGLAQSIRDGLMAGGSTR